MDYSNITAQAVLQNRRAQPPFEIPADASIDIPVRDAEYIRRTLRYRLAKAGNTGFWKRVSAIVLEPANPFNTKAQRKFRQEANVLIALLLLTFLIVAFFNFSAILR
jgi:hypothetical protein